MWFKALPIVAIAACVNLFAPAPAPAAQHGEETLRFGLLPALSPQYFVERFTLMSDYLSDQLGRPVRLVGSPNYAEFIRRAEEGGHYDLIITGSDVYRYLEKKAGYRAMVRVGGTGIALIVTRTDSGIESLADLEGKIIATPDPLSLAKRLGAAKLLEAGITLGGNAEILITPTQNASMQSMFLGLSDAAVFMEPVFNRASPETKAQIRVLAESNPAVNHPISLAPGLSDELFEQITQILTEMKDTPEGMAFFEAVRFPPFVPVVPGEFDTMDWAVEIIEDQLDAVQTP